MRYHYTKDTLFVWGDFKAVSTGVDGGIRYVSTLMNHTVPKDFCHDNPLEYIRNILSENDFKNDAFGLLTAVWMQDLCVVQYDYITVFVTAGVSNPNPDPTKPHTINIIVVSAEGFSDAALLETIITATEAKAHALRLLGRDFTGTTSDAVIAAYETGEIKHTYAGTFTEPGKRIYASVLHGVTEAIKRHEGTVVRNRPSFFIYSRYGNTGWFEWIKEDCPYYPCHFKGQVCDFCYCPFYPCKDESLGGWVASSTDGEPVWACTECHLLHNKKTAEYLIKHPKADLEELKNV
ncbi:MAG: adenosylcobinamide amidohydrolase [Methanocorpusculum sp.]|nr:adenosylcobinamide amidohydrolase [Methanocorpusculum sp.]